MPESTPLSPCRLEQAMSSKADHNLKSKGSGLDMGQSSAIITSGPATPEQIEALLSFLDEHKDLARGRLRSIEAKVQAKRLWEELCNSLNAMGGSTKTAQQWQKVWFDRKHLAKKAEEVHRQTHWELKVLSIMGERALVTSCKHRETVCCAIGPSKFSPTEP
ncbi:hypothetical protein evm_004166 [Chilo suppressalis]|nr:hypothetical protein evm_004166 [Chilo suppressalis]